MKTAKEILENDGLTEHDQCEGYVLKVKDIVDYMEKYAELYHESKVKKLNVIHFVCLNGKEPINCPIFDIQRNGCYSCDRYVQKNDV